MPPDKSLIARLRSADEDDAIAALVNAYVALPLTTPAELIEAYNLILDRKLPATES